MDFSNDELKITSPYKQSSLIMLALENGQYTVSVSGFDKKSFADALHILSKFELENGLSLVTANNDNTVTTVKV